MKVKDIMSRNVRSCGPEANLATAATLMWEGDCGVIPVLEDGRRVKGVITDRDICIAVATRHRRADEIGVGELVSGQVFACGPEDELRSALETMKEHKVRRMPVVGKEGELLGMLSLNDIVLEAKEGKGRKSIGQEEVLDALKSICEHRLVAVAA